nr:hypothetical protein [Tanacetum cinerariifolium]
MVVEDDEMSKKKGIDKLMALISLSFNKIYKPTNNNLKTSSNTSRGTGYDNQRAFNVVGARETVQNNDHNNNVFAIDKPHHEQPESINATYLDKQGDNHIIFDSIDMSTNGDQDDQDDDDLAKERDLLASLIDKLKYEIDDSKNHDEMSKKKGIDKLMALISLSFNKIYKPTNNNLKTSSNTSRGTGYDNQRAFNVVGARETVQNNDHNNNVFAIDKPHHEQPESINATYLDKQGDNHIIFDSIDMSTNGDQDDQDDDDLAKERDLLASLIDKLKYEIDDSKNRNKLLESSNKILVDKLKSETEDFKNKTKCLESSNTHFKEANTKLFQYEVDKHKDVKYMSKAELDCAKAKAKLMSHKMCFEKSFCEYNHKINDLNHTILDVKNKLVAHQETITIITQQKEAQKKFHKTRKDKELEKVIALENKIKVFDDIVYKVGQSVQTMNMLNRNCKTNFVKPELLKKAQRANHRLYDIENYNDNIALMLALEYDEMISIAQES